MAKHPNVVVLHRFQERKSGDVYCLVSGAAFVTILEDVSSQVPPKVRKQILRAADEYGAIIPQRGRHKWLFKQCGIAEDRSLVIQSIKHGFPPFLTN